MKEEKLDVTKLAASCLQMIELRGYSLHIDYFDTVIDYANLYDEKLKQAPELSERIKQYDIKPLLEKTAALQLLTRIIQDVEIEMPIQIDGEHLDEVLDTAMEQICILIDRYGNKKKCRKRDV